MTTTHIDVFYQNTLLQVEGLYYAVPIGFDQFDAELTEPPEDAIELSHHEETAGRALALRLHLDEWKHNVTAFRDGDVFMGQKRWFVLTNREADELWNTYLQDELNRALVYLPVAMAEFFNQEEYKEHTKTFGKRGRALSPHDAQEVVIETELETFYLYRQK